MACLFVVILLASVSCHFGLPTKSTGASIPSSTQISVEDPPPLDQFFLPLEIRNQKDSEGPCSQQTQKGLRCHHPKPAVAICLTGHLKSFPYTVSSIVQNLIKYVAQNSKLTHIYVSSFMTKPSHLIHLLPRGIKELSETIPSVKLVEIHMPFQHPSKHTLLPGTMRAGTQGTSAFFNLTGACNGLILRGEHEHSVRYDTIIRARLGSLWTTSPDSLPLSFPPPPKVKENIEGETKEKGNDIMSQQCKLTGEHCFYHPQMYNFRGVNDRFAIGPRSIMLAVNNRFRNAKKIYETWPNAETILKNSEMSLKMELFQSQICSKPLSGDAFPCPVPFCLVQKSVIPFEAGAGGNVYQQKEHLHIADGGKCYLPQCNTPAQCSKKANMPSSSFKALNWIEKIQEMEIPCIDQLTEAFVSTNTTFTGDSSFEDACALKEDLPASSPGYQRAKSLWQEYRKITALDKAKAKTKQGTELEEKQRKRDREREREKKAKREREKPFSRRMQADSRPTRRRH